MNSLYIYFNSFNLFTNDEIELAIKESSIVTINKNENFIAEGELVNKVGFLKSGIIRSYYYSSTDEEVTYCFQFPGEFVTAYSSYISGNPSKENMQAINDCELIVFNKNSIDKWVKDSYNWLFFLKNIAEQQYIHLERRIFQLQKETALNRYKDLLTHHKEYVQKIPLQFLASYLGISQRHLSRLRKQITDGIEN